MSLRLKSLRSAPTSVRVRSVPVRISRPSGRPIVLPAALPTVSRVSSFGSRTPATFSAGRSVVLLSPIVLPIRELEFTVRERWFVADCLFVIETDGSFLPIILPMPWLRSVRSDDWLLFTVGGVTILSPDEVEGLVELTAGCFAPVGAGELRVPIVLPIRERWLVVGSFFAFERDGVLRLIESPIREAPLERAAGCSAPLGTDGLVVSIVLPIRDVMLGLIRPLEFVSSEVEGLLDGVLVLIELPIREVIFGLTRPLEFVSSEVEGLLDGVLVLIELPIRDVMLGLTRPLEFVSNEVGGLLDGVLVLIELPIREVMLGLTRPLEFVSSEVEGLL